MKIISTVQEDMTKHGKTTDCLVHSVHVKVQNVQARAEEMITSISDTSWIGKLDAIDQAAYKARAAKTINKLVNEILKKVENELPEDFGEYLISDVAQNVLNSSFRHTKVPLAELLKEKLSNNMGFDFHTENTGNLIVYGEAKYSGSDSPYTNAITQIVDFIKDEKDIAELVHLRKFVSDAAAKNAIKKQKAYVAAFSINAKNPQTILNNALKSGHLDGLLSYPELYLIGVEIDA